MIFKEFWKKRKMNGSSWDNLMISNAHRRKIRAHRNNPCDVPYGKTKGSWTQIPGFTEKKSLERVLWKCEDKIEGPGDPRLTIQFE